MPKVLKPAVIGDTTTTGGEIIDGAKTMTDEGHLLALIGSKVKCPACNSIGVIRKTSIHEVTVEQALVALDGDVVECKCTPLGVNKVVVNQVIYDITGYEDGTVSMKLEDEVGKQILKDLGITIVSTADSSVT